MFCGAGVLSCDAFRLDALSTSPSRTATSGLIQSVAASVVILDALARVQRALGVTELARAIGEPKARVHRHLTTLRTLGLVDQDPDSGHYRLGWKTLELGQAAVDQLEIRRVAEPYLQRLRDLSGQTAVLSVPAAGEAIVVLALESPSLVTISVRRGARLPAHASAQGRIAAAFADDQTRKRLLAGRLPKLTATTLVRRAELEKRFAEIRARLYEIADGETLAGIATIAAPVLDQRNRLLGVVALVGSLQYIHAPVDAQQLRLVQGCAAAISARFSGLAYRDLGVTVPKEMQLD